MPNIIAKLGNMRKPQSFTVYPRKSPDEEVRIQSDKSIGVFDPKTGKGRLNTKGCYFVHLSPAAGAVEYQFPPEVVAAATGQPIVKTGEEITPGIYMA